MYSRKARGWMKHLDFILLDIICMQFALVVAYAIRHRDLHIYANSLYLNMGIVISFINFFVAVFFESYKNVIYRGMYQELSMTVKHACLVMAGALVYIFSTQTGESYSRITLGLMGVFYVFLGYAVRILWKYHLLRRQNDKNKHTLMIVTTDDIVRDVVSELCNRKYEKFRVTGIAVINKDMVGEKICGVEVLAGGDDVAGYICRHWVDEVFVNISDSYPYPDELISKLGDYTVLTTAINVATMKQMALKRAIDIVGGLIGCLITGVLFLILAPIIKIQSPGPVFFRQKRIGKNGKVFYMYKFRSMVMNAEELKKDLLGQNEVSDGMMFKIAYDPRIIGCKKLPDGTVKKGVGNYIRDWSLDEFPQFFNVLKGDMSLVGTRPPTLDEWEKYELSHRARMATKPGITGMWQVSGRSRITDFSDVLKLDTEYIMNWSMGLDCRILFKTVQVVLLKDGAM